MKKQENLIEGYITLKEAARISGYSADYIGQLIRKGKIPGRQIYTNIAWVTTQADLEEYLSREGKGKKLDEGLVGAEQVIGYELEDEEVVGLDSQISHHAITEQMIKWILYIALVLGVICLIALFYVLSVTIDHRLNGGHVGGAYQSTKPTAVLETNSQYARR